MKIFLPVVLSLAVLGVPTATAQEQQQQQLDANQSLFAVMAAYHAAGFDGDMGSAANSPVRAEVLKYIQQKNPPVLAELRQYLKDHPNATISNYISLGLTLEGPPLFRIAKGLKEPPPDSVLLQSFLPLVAKLWAEADLDTVWRRIEPEYSKLIAEKYHEPVTQEVYRANAFLRNPTSGARGRRFQIYVELMAPPNQVHTRSFGDDFYVVVTPSPEPQIADLRRAYLFYLLDPLSIRFSKLIGAKDGLLQFAKLAPALDPHFKEDFALLTTASLVRAVDAKLTPVSGNAKLQIVDQFFREGFILTPFFYEQLPLYEKQELAMRLYYPEMINAIDLGREDKRLSNVEWAKQKESKVIHVTSEAKRPVLTGALKTLEEAEDLYNQKQYPRAKEKFEQALRETDAVALHAKAYFGLARVAALNRDFEQAVKLFERTLELQPEDDIKAWTLVYLGRLLYSVNELEPSVEKYKAALAVKGAPERARQAAEKGLQEATGRKK
ncbi:MAG: tetratricopeptide repeat protein [Acidobacteria bacterium]|nr:tetratricopeptide repeat protein [Acidobacteriota bacterium]